MKEVVYGVCERERKNVTVLEKSERKSEHMQVILTLETWPIRINFSFDHFLGCIGARYTVDGTRYRGVFFFSNNINCIPSSPFVH